VLIEKLRDHLRKLTKKAAKFYSEKANQEEMSIVETGFFRKSAVSLKEIFQQLYRINDYSEGYFRNLINVKDNFIVNKTFI